MTKLNEQFINISGFNTKRNGNFSVDINYFIFR